MSATSWWACGEVLQQAGRRSRKARPGGRRLGTGQPCPLPLSAAPGTRARLHAERKNEPKSGHRLIAKLLPSFQVRDFMDSQVTWLLQEVKQEPQDLSMIRCSGGSQLSHVQPPVPPRGCRGMGLAGRSAPSQVRKLHCVDERELGDRGKGGGREKDRERERKKERERDSY